MIGQTLSHYKITDKLGEGGMGEVYRAEDTTLKREVAIKVLPGQFTQDGDRLARFEREAQLLASLNHPNIAAIHSFEHSDGVHFLAMELVEGETLAQRVAKGPLPLEEALEVCRQIAEGLEAAHESGVIHRDLKPANVNITPEGKVKILDFGLAKALEGEIPAADISQSPTRTGEMTSAGVILGTAAYMSPEQARGKPVDKRTDIWAFGCVLFEALTGRQEFGGETISDCIAKVLQKEPDWEALPKDTPRAIQRLLRRCLEKDPHERLHHIADARIEVREALSHPLGITPLPVEAPLPRSSWRLALPWVLVGVLIVALTVALIDPGETPHRAGTTHFLISPPETLTLAGIPIVSPDGKQVLFVGTDETGKKGLWVFKMDSSAFAQRLDGTDQAQAFSGFWSPDSRYIGFLAEGKLKKIDPSGGPAVSFADAVGFVQGVTWNRQGTILFGSSRGPIYRVYAAGGEATAVTQLDQSRQEETHRWPYFLPNGSHFLYKAWAKREEDMGIYVGSLDSNETKFLVNTSRWSAVAYSPPGYLLFVREGTLMAQRFDVAQLEVSGEAFPIAEQMGRFSTFSVSENGVLTYQTSSPKGQLVWRDRSGKLLETVGEPGGYIHIDLSRDEKRVAVAKDAGSLGVDLWLLELSTGIFSRFTSDPARDESPIWSPDGRRLVFNSRRTVPAGLFQKTVGGSEVEVLFEEASSWPQAWSRDGDILFLSIRAEGASLYALRQDQEGKWEPRVLLENSSGKDGFRLSPDEKWISYDSNESGRRQVYIASFPDFSNERQVSRAGGVRARWRGDGKELFFLQLDGKLMSAEVRQGAALETSIPKVLFDSDSGGSSFGIPYDVSSDGQRFLLVEGGEGIIGPMHVVLNWFEELKRMVPTDN